MFQDLTVLNMAWRKLGWLAKRQQVLSQNIANADTPGYVPEDLKKINFQSVLNQTGAPAVEPVADNPRHIVPRLTDPNQVMTAQHYQTSPSGNGVSLDDQMEKVGATKDDYEQVTTLFQKQIAMLKTAITGQ
jgi:flagellar basal-body rod protein FlgB